MVREIIDWFADTQLPPDIAFYDIDGKRLFPITKMGLITLESICYLITKPEEGFRTVYKFGIKIKHDETKEEIIEKLTASRDLFLQKLMMNTASSVNLEGGDFGLEG